MDGDKDASVEISANGIFVDVAVGVNGAGMWSRKPLALRGGVPWRAREKGARNAPTRTAQTPRSALNFSGFFFLTMGPFIWQ
jgi:hypothetical protein